jgi:hypothetical protein
MIIVGLAKIIQRIAFNNLRPMEVEHIYEKSWYTITETCLTMTIFRNEFNLKFVVLFTCLLICKVYHWIIQDRIEYVEQTPSIRRLFHIRLGTIMMLLAIIDSWFAVYYLRKVIKLGPSMMIFFGFEYLALAVMINSMIIKYMIYRFDQIREIPWENKSTLIFYLELATDFCRLTVYLIFFSVIFFHYGLPLHIIRDLYQTFRSLLLRVRDLTQYQRATANMEERYPNATEEELALIDRICIICREEMNIGKKLPCGHIFHFQCLRLWLERQQICPTCRISVLQTQSQETSATTASHREAVTNNERTNHEVHETPRVPATPPPRILTGPYTVWVPAVQIPSTNQDVFSNTNTTSQEASPDFLRSLRDLDEDTLRQMEGQQRHQLEKRLEFLIDMQDQINNLIVRITQYLDMDRNISYRTVAPSAIEIQGESSSSSNPSETIHLEARIAASSESSS